MRNFHGRFKQRGSSLAEFIYTIPVLLLLGLGSVQAGLIYHGKTTLNYATFEAARNGAVNHAQFDAMKDELSFRLAPLHGGDGTAGKAAQAIAMAKATSLLPARTNIRILNPTPAAFEDWGEMSLDAGVRAIPNSHLRNRTADRNTIGALSGLNLHDANLLKIEVTHGFRMKIPIVSAVIAKGMMVIDSDNTYYYLQNQLPITSIVTVRMQNEAWEQDVDAGSTPPVPVTNPETADGTTTANTLVPEGEGTEGVPTETNGTEGTTTASTDGGQTGTTDTAETTDEIQCETTWEDERYTANTDNRWWNPLDWEDDVKAAAAIVLDFFKGALAGLGDQVKELWELLKDPTVLWDLAKSFIDNPRAMIEAIVKDLGEQAQRVLNCGPKDIGKVIGQNINPAIAVKLLGKLGSLSGNAKLADYAADYNKKFVCASFPAETLVWTNSGTLAIEDIVAGDGLKTRHDKSLVNGVESVKATFSRFAEGYHRIETEIGVLLATPEHPLWVQGKGWVEAKDIEWEDPIATVSGDAVAYGNNFVGKKTKVYNLSISNTHTYFVGHQGFWVHNADCKVTFVSRKDFDELTFDVDKGKVTSGSIEELRAAYAAEIGGLIPNVAKRGTRGADFELVDGTLIDVKAPRANYFKDRQQLLKVKGELASEPKMKILIDNRNLTDAELEIVLQRAEAVGIPRDKFIIPDRADYGVIKVEGQDF